MLVYLAAGGLDCFHFFVTAVQDSLSASVLACMTVKIMYAAALLNKGWLCYCCGIDVTCPLLQKWFNLVGSSL
jgi:hypothetical protein